MIIVTGSTGTIGRSLLPLLAASGRAAIGITRNSEAILPSGIRPIVADLTRASSLSGVMCRGDTLVLITSGLDQFEQESNALWAAAQAGVFKVIKVSAMSVTRKATDAITQAHRAIEVDLQQSDFNWSIVRCNAFMSNTLNWKWTINRDGVVYAPFANDPVSAVAPEDIARLIVALLEERASDAMPEATGPEAISPAQQVAVLAEKLGRPISVIDVPPDAYRDQLVANDVDANLADALIGMFAEALDPDSARVSNDIGRWTGREATSFEDWVETNLAAFKGD